MNLQGLLQEKSYLHETCILVVPPEASELTLDLEQVKVMEVTVGFYIFI